MPLIYIYIYIYIYIPTICLKLPWCAFLHGARSSGKGYEALGIWQHKYTWNDASNCFNFFRRHANTDLYRFLELKQNGSFRVLYQFFGNLYFSEILATCFDRAIKPCELKRPIEQSQKSYVAGMVDIHCLNFDSA